MGHQNAQYLKLKGTTYYFSRRVPKRLQRHCSTTRIEVCLHTSSRHHAARQSIIMSSQLEDQWKLLRRKDMSCRLWRHFEAHPILTPAAAMTHRDQTLTRAPLLSDAAETYVSMKGARSARDLCCGSSQIHRLSYRGHNRQTNRCVCSS